MVALSLKLKNWRPLVWLLAGAVVLIGSLFLNNMGRLLLVPGLTALIWGIPGLILGIVTPFLEPPSEAHPTWLPVCLVVASILMGLNLLVYRLIWFWLAAFLLLAGAYAVWLKLALKDIWPLIALCVATVVVGTMALIQKASFGGVLAEIHAMNHLPFGDRGTARLKERLGFHLQFQSVPDLKEELNELNQPAWDAPIRRVGELILASRSLQYKI
jgi:hypothetical protein